MMGAVAAALAERLMAVGWSGRAEQRRSQVALVREHLRRMAWRAQELGSPKWPFFDVAALVDPAVRADAKIVARVEESLPGWVFPPVVQTCEWALHFAELQDRGTPPETSDPFAPLILMFERGNVFGFDAAGYIEVDCIGIRRGRMDEYLAAEPFTSLEPTALDLLDQHGAGGRPHRARRFPARRWRG